eukprot:TRINITY_DN8356_c0_g1_i1.p1 TRINITY_DN8356_c0_g1~~TRINITY_DN8356_c0_g1_i1.p1  ORF type:complete len:235 (-),score=53.04 TRINITY_DN8356_c0_g1_i1:37-741(-)
METMRERSGSVGGRERSASIGNGRERSGSTTTRPGNKPARTFVVAYNGCLSSEMALYHAVDLCDNQNDKIILVNVVTVVGDLEKGKETLKHGQGLLQVWTTSPENWNTSQLLESSVRFESKLIDGSGVDGTTKADVKEELCRICGELNADYLVMGSQSGDRSFWSNVATLGLGSGSTSAYCLRHAPCPVIAVRQKRPRELERERVVVAMEEEKQKTESAANSPESNKSESSVIQ